MKRVRGRIVFVQEGRFMLRANNGAGQTFTLSHKAALEPQQLPPLQRAQALVEIDYVEENGGMSAVAHVVRVADDAVAARAEAI